jgi:TonB-linked SusC/RagA family outer membrane protein
MYFLQRLSFLYKKGKRNLADLLPDSNQLKWIVMRLQLIALVVFIACLQVTASSFGQLRLKADKTPLKKVLEEIENQSGMVFMYNNALLNTAKPVSIEAKDLSLEAMLKKVFENQPLSYQVIDKTIVLKGKSIPFVKDLVDVAGRVLDENGKPLPGVIIYAQGTEQKTTSDKAGYFKLAQVDKLSVLLFSYVGYERRYVKVSEIDNDKFTVTMKPSSTSLNEVVMVGYGTTRRKDLTGSVSSVNINEINNTPLVTIDQALAGKASGVMVTQSDGSPGGVARIRIRGGASLLGGNDPLYVIDGVQINISNQYLGAGADVQNPIAALGSSREPSINTAVGSSYARGLNTLAGINLNDIEDIVILKDASATAIYGSRAANGVVIITTKKGKKNEKPQLEANYYSALTRALTADVLNADQYKKVFLEASGNLNARLASNGQPADAAASAFIADPSLLGTGNTNWIDLVTRTGITHNADISVRGGGSASSYYMSLGYNKNQGTIVGTDFSRIAGKINLTNELGEKVRLIANLDMGFTKNNITNAAYAAALLAPPTFSPYNADGSLQLFTGTTFPGGGTGFGGPIVNPLALLQGINRAEGNTLLGSLMLQYDVLKDLRFTSSVTVNNTGSNQLNYTPSTVGTAGSFLATSPGVGGQAQSRFMDIFYENILTWNKDFNEDNRLNIVGGTTWQKTTSKSFSANAQGFPDDSFLNGLSSAAVFLRPTAQESYTSMLSFYLRANYALKDRYLLTVTGRSDASSKFPKSTRVFYTPSFGLAWRINEESFLKHVKWLNELKLRISAGYTGNQNVGNNVFYTLYTPVNYVGDNALIPSQLGNDEIRPEKTLQKDLGLDFAAFGNRLTASIGYYEKSTRGVLMATEVPLSSGFSSVYTNKADVLNKGLEIELRGDVLRSKNFNWNVALNVSGNRSRLTGLNRLLPNATSIGSDNPLFTGETIGNSALVPGRPLGEIYGSLFLGLITTQAQLDQIRSAMNIFPAYLPGIGGTGTLGIGSPLFQTYGEAFPGNPAVAGIVGSLPNRTRIGSGVPKFFGGMTHTFNYKKFSVIALLSYAYGGQLMYLPEANTFGLGDIRNRITSVLEPYFTPENPTATRPTLLLRDTNNWGGLARSNSNIVFDGSYIKLKSINISYALPQAFLNKLGVRSALIYVSGSNLFTITKYPGPDPEVSNDPYSIQGGFTDDGAYPQSRQYSMGLRFTF